MFELLQENDAYIETPFTVEDFTGLAVEVGRNPIMQVLNIAVVDILKNALDEGWIPEDMKLGAFIRSQIEGIPFHDIDESFEDPDFSDSQEALELIDRFGEAYADGGSMPLIVMKNRKTGKLFEASEEQLEEYFGREEVLKFLEKNAE